MKRSNKRYASEFKTQTISLVRDAHRPAVEVAMELNINVNTLYNWLSSASNKLSRNLLHENYHTEIKRLKKDLAQAELERDIFKKRPRILPKQPYKIRVDKRV